MSKGISKTVEDEEPFYVRRKPDPVPFSKFLYNSDKGTIMGRTGGSWGKYILCIRMTIISVTNERGKLLLMEEHNTNTCAKLTYRCGVYFSKNSFCGFLIQLSNDFAHTHSTKMLSLAGRLLN